MINISSIGKVCFISSLSFIFTFAVADDFSRYPAINTYLKLSLNKKKFTNEEKVFKSFLDERLKDRNSFNFSKLTYARYEKLEALASFSNNEKAQKKYKLKPFSFSTLITAQYLKKQIKYNDDFIFAIVEVSPCIDPGFIGTNWAIILANILQREPGKLFRAVVDSSKALSQLKKEPENSCHASLWSDASKSEGETLHANRIIALLEVVWPSSKDVPEALRSKINGLLKIYGKEKSLAPMVVYANEYLLK